MILAAVLVLVLIFVAAAILVVVLVLIVVLSLILVIHNVIPPDFFPAVVNCYPSMPGMSGFILGSEN